MEDQDQERHEASNHGQGGCAPAETLPLESLPACPSVEEQNALIDYLKTADLSEIAVRLRDKNFREVANGVFVYWKLRTQIRVLREQRGWTQDDLARRTGFHQSFVSRFENIYYPVDITIRTLKRFAHAFDVVLRVGFMDWGTLLQDISDMSDESLRVKSFDDDPFFQRSTDESDTAEPETSDSATQQPG